MYRKILLTIVYTYHGLVVLSPCLFNILTKGTSCFLHGNNLYTSAKQYVSNIGIMKELPVIQNINYTFTNYFVKLFGVNV